MPRQVSRTAYELDELDETARERAREQYKALGVYDRWYDDVFEHFTRVCAGLGVEIATRRTQTIGGDEAYELQVFYQNLGGQNEGARFEGHYSDAPDAVETIRTHEPEERALHEIAEALDDVQRRNARQLRASVRCPGIQDDEHAMVIAVEHADQYAEMTDDAEATVESAMRKLTRWLRKQLNEEYEDITSDEALDEGIRSLEWLFDERGEPLFGWNESDTGIAQGRT